MLTDVKLKKSSQLNKKLKTLKRILSDMGSVLVAYSGGVDSTFLLKISKDVLKNKVLAVIARSETYPRREVKQAIDMAKRLKVPFLVIETKEIEDNNFASNPEDRCYWCKKELFSKMSKIATKKRIAFVVDGSNYDDLSDFRPGSIAAEELNIRRPLVEAGLRKDEIRQISKLRRLSTWNKPSFACLASRFPYGSKIDKKALIKINKAEEYIMNLGVRQLRVRHFRKIAKIEVSEKDIFKIFKNRKKIIRYFKKLGYLFVTVDLEGYKTGSMNKILTKNKQDR